LEAMAAGAPVVASRVGAIPEVAGDAALLVNAEKPAEVADAIETVLTDAALRTDLITRGRARAARFTWEAVARQTLDVYESVHAGPPSAGASHPLRRWVAPPGGCPRPGPA